MHIRKHRKRRFSIGLAGLVLIVGVCLDVAATEGYWYESYQRSVELIEDGRMEQASRILEPLVQDQPVPVAGVRIPGSQVLDYFPHYQLARIRMHEGDIDGAMRHLDVSESYGAVKKSPKTMAVLTELRRTAAVRSVEKAAVYDPVAASAKAPSPR